MLVIIAVVTMLVFEGLGVWATDSRESYQQYDTEIAELKKALGGFAENPVISWWIGNVTVMIRETNIYSGNIGLVIDLVSVKLQKLFVEISSALSQAQLASGHVPGVRNVMTSGEVKASMLRQLTQLDKRALNLVNEWEFGLSE
jgi:hypothetical protein